MGSFPLAALHLNPPPQQENPIESLGRILQLKQAMTNAPLQTQQLQQQVQAGQQENQQRAIQLNDQQAMSKAMQAWDGKSLNDLAPLVIKNGGSANAVMGLKQKALEMQEKYSTIAKTDAETGASNIATMMKKNDLISGAFSTVLQTPDEQLPQAITTTAQQLAQQGLLDPQHVQMAQQIAQQPPTQARLALDTMRKGMMADTQLLDEAKQKASIAETQAQTQKLQQETQFGPSGPAAEAKYRFILQKAASGQQLSPEETDYARGFEASNAKNTTQADSLGVTSTNTSRPAGLATVARGQSRPQNGGAPLLPSSNLPSASAMSPANVKSSIVDEIGQYKADPALLGRMMYKHPEILGMVNQKYPDWDQTTYTAKNALIKGYTSGTQSKEINAINTAMGHVKVMDDAVDALNNGNIVALNKIGNSLGINLTGQTAPAAFRLIVHRVGPEIASSYIPGGGGEGERIADAKDFDESLPAQTLHNNAAITVKLLRSKVGSLENQYKNTVGRDDFNKRFITPEANASFQKFSGGPPSASGGISVTAPNGKVYTFKDQASADAFKKNAGIQ